MGLGYGDVCPFSQLQVAPTAGTDAFPFWDQVTVEDCVKVRSIRTKTETHTQADNWRVASSLSRQEPLPPEGILHALLSTAAEFNVTPVLLRKTYSSIVNI